MTEPYFSLELQQALDTKLTLAERLGKMHRAAQEGVTRQAMQLYVLENHIQQEVDIRYAKVAQAAMAAASRGFKDSFTTFKDVSITRDVRFDLDILGIANCALQARLEESGISVLGIEGARTVYTNPPGPEWRYWGEVDYLETVVHVGW